MTGTFEGKLYRKISGTRYDYWASRVEQNEDKLLVNLLSFGRFIALSLASDDGAWAVPIDGIEVKAQEIVDDWPIEEVLAVGKDQLPEWNNMGLKAEDAVEKN